jgi:two-component system OmpR family sensor kinase
MSSLRNTLLAWLLGAVALIGLGGAGLSYRNALAEANGFFDNHLRETALLLRDQVRGFGAGPRLPQPVPGYDLVVQVWSLDGVRIYLSRPHAVLPGLTTLGLSTAQTEGGSWRVYGVEADGRVIQVVQPMEVRKQRAARLALKTITPFAILLPALALLVAWIVGRSVRPVRAFADTLRARRPDDLTPVPLEGLPDEARPMATALNDLLARLDLAIERERAFIADAAHELRTPLTALSLQLQSLAAAGATVEDRDAAVRNLEAGVARAARLIEQLLAVAREQHAGERELRPLHLDEFVRQVVADWVPLAEAADLDLGIAEAEVVRVLAEEDGLRVLLGNLLDNAIRYTPRGGRVDVRVSHMAGSPARAVLSVTDTGPGIPEAERGRVFDRFHRVPGTVAGGSGLGLALVRSVASRHEGQVVLESGPGGTGLRVVVTLPALPAS